MWYKNCMYLILILHFSCKFYHMKSIKSALKNVQKELFRIELIQIIDRDHSLAKLSKVVDWDRLEEVFSSTYCPDNGRPAISTWLMVAPHYLKYTHNLSDEDVVVGWAENPYWQYFSGMKYFEHKVPIHPSSMLFPPSTPRTLYINSALVAHSEVSVIPCQHIYLNLSRSGSKPMSGIQTHFYQHQHCRNLDKDTHNRGQRRSWWKAE
mgnify:FL=1